MEAATASCAMLSVACVANTRPARGVLSLASAPVSAEVFCRAGAAHSDWLPRHVPQEVAASGCLPCPTNSLLPHHGLDDPPLSECTPSATFRVLQCLPTGVLQQSSEASGDSDVLLVHSDNRGHGLFAMVERVINQVLYAQTIGLVPYVFIGEYVFAEGRACEHGRVPYYDEARGPNVWEYFFKQPDARVSFGAPTGAAAMWPRGRGRLGRAMRRHKRGRGRGGGGGGSSSGRRLQAADASPPVRRLADARPARSVQAVPPEALYALGLHGNHTQTYTGGSAYDGRRRGALRRAASRLLGGGGMVRAVHTRRAQAAFAPWRASSGHILGLHVRGTDKVVAKKVPPEAYFPFIDAWIHAHPHDARVFVATDERAYHERLVRKYGAWNETGGAGGGGTDAGGGRVLSAGRGYRSLNVIADETLTGGQKGDEVLLDALPWARSGTPCMYARVHPLMCMARARHACTGAARRAAALQVRPHPSWRRMRGTRVIVCATCTYPPLLLSSCGAGATSSSRPRRPWPSLPCG